MSNDYDKKMSLIKNLFARANHPNTPPEEAELARKRALKMCAQLSVDEAQVDEHGNSRHEIMKEEVAIPGPHADVLVLLMSELAKVFNCRVIIKSVWKNGRTSLIDAEGWCNVTLYGYGDDMDIVLLLHDSLFNDFYLNAMDAAKNKALRGSARARVAGFVNGYVVEVASRARQFYREAVADAAEGKALVLANRGDEVQAHIDKMNTRQGRGTRYYNDSMMRGMQDGRNADIALNNKFHQGSETPALTA